MSHRALSEQQFPSQSSQRQLHPWHDRGAFEASLVGSRHTDDPMKCADCVSQSESAAWENWSEGDDPHNPRQPKTDEDHAEIAQWAKYYRESGDSRCEVHSL